MKKLILITGIVIYVLFAVSAIFTNNRQVWTEPLDATFPTEAVTSSESGYLELYVIKNLDGKIAVEDGNTGKILKTTDTQVALLPEADRKQLNDGIKVEGKNALRSLLEDFCS